MDSEKGIVTVVGEVDPVYVTNQIRKSGKFAEIISVGPPKKPDPSPSNKQPNLPPCCPQCQVVTMRYEPSYDSFCSIL